MFFFISKQRLFAVAVFLSGLVGDYFICFIYAVIMSLLDQNHFVNWKKSWHVSCCLPFES